MSRRSYRHPTRLVVEARTLRAEGMTCRAIADQLKATHGLPTLSPNTVLAWVDATYADSRCAANATYHATKRNNHWKFRLGGRVHTDAYKAAFVRRLAADQVPRAAIKKVCDVLFEDPPTKGQITEFLTQTARAAGASTKETHR